MANENLPQRLHDNRQALAELKLCAVVLRAMQPSTILNSLDIARAAVNVAIADLAAVVELSEKNHAASS